MSVDFLSSRIPTNWGCLSSPSRVHSTYATSPTTAGFTHRSVAISSAVIPSPQCEERPAFGRSTKGHPLQRLLRDPRQQLRPDVRRQTRAHLGGVVQRLPFVIAHEERFKRAPLRLCPPITNSRRGLNFTLTHVGLRSPERYRESRRFATTPS